jgi:division protein CdvB (Snf7/Vps24/ESCRT-III family)
MYKKEPSAEPTQATLYELIDQKFFLCETRLREHLTTLITPYVKQTKDNATSNRILMEEHYRTQKTMEQVDLHSKLLQHVSKRQEELAKSIETVNVSVGEVLDKAHVLVSKQKARIDTVIEEIG